MHEEDKNNILENKRKGMQRIGYLFSTFDLGHTYSLLDEETFFVNNNNYQVLKIENLWEFTGIHFLESNDNLLLELRDSRTKFES